jgi:hypothetical protein
MLFACAQRLLSMFELRYARLQFRAALVQLLYFREELLPRLPVISHFISALWHSVAI